MAAGLHTSMRQIPAFLTALVLSAVTTPSVQAATLALEAVFNLDGSLSRPANNFHPQGLGYDPGSNELLFIQQGASRIYRSDLTGTVTGYRDIGGIAYLPNGSFTSSALYTTSVAGDGSNYYFSEYTGNSSGYDLYSLGKTSGTAAHLGNEIQDYAGYPIDVRDGTLYRTETSTFYDWGALSDIRISSLATPDATIQTVTLATPAGIGDIAVDSGRNIIWTIDYAAGASLRQFDLTTGTQLDVFNIGGDGLTAGITFADDKLYHYEWIHGSGSTLSVYSFGEVASVPLPASVLMLVAACGALGSAGWRSRRSGSRVTVMG